MTNDEILYEAIEKAVDNGFLVPKTAWNKEIYVHDDLSFITIIWDFYQTCSEDDEWHESDGKCSCEPYCCGVNRDVRYSVNDIIFLHNFAKAFFGYKLIEQECSVVEIPAWKYHLQQMVLTKDPIKYLEKFL